MTVSMLAIYLVKLFLLVFLYLMKSIGNLLLNFEDLVIDYETFKKEILELIAVVQRGLKAARIVVSTMEDRDALTWEQIG